MVCMIRFDEMFQRSRPLIHCGLYIMDLYRRNGDSLLIGITASRTESGRTKWNSKRGEHVECLGLWQGGKSYEEIQESGREGKRIMQVGKEILAGPYSEGGAERVEMKETLRCPAAPLPSLLIAASYVLFYITCPEDSRRLEKKMRNHRDGVHLKRSSVVRYVIIEYIAYRSSV
jgi:hypothetical protein